MAANASRIVPESTVRRLDDGAKGNAGQGKADEMRDTHGAGGGVLAAGNVLLALLVDQVLNGDGNENRDLEIELGALVEETKTVGAGATADQVAKSATEHAGVDVGGVTSVGGLVAARELSLVTTLGLSLLDCHVVRDREADIGVALVVDTVGVANTASSGSRGKSGSEASESENGGDSELHCDCGFGIERRSRRYEIESERLKSREEKIKECDA
ncbi:hypothetical protein N7451_007965 [Penicillium sp. IBT 35674x]|nr:hypothetical protein N7451_007965 [Penicillium sp. IBT 35674x]